MIGTAAGVRGEATAVCPIRGTREAVYISRHTDRRAPASTFLVHFFGRPVAEERTYAVERITGLSNGDISRQPADGTGTKKARGRPKPEVVTFDEVRDMRPAYNEIIVCTAWGSHSGVQFWGWSVAGFSGERRQRR